ncbi:MAG: DUF1246 domain-containing protein, partial [Thaumarchaeota archaeon]
MIKRSVIQKIVNEYSGLTVGTLGSHSALEIMDGAKDENLQTLVVCQKGREIPYKRFSRLSDKIIIVKKFKEMLSPTIQARLRSLGYSGVENNFNVPIFGNRALFQAEERSHPKNQYYLLEKAKIKHPKLFKNPKDIDRPVIVKVQEKSRKLERAFFNVSSYSEYKDKTETKIRRGLVSKDSLKIASIEEFVIGTYFNFNYFHTPISNEVDFIGIERRLQTNLHDFNSLPARQQLE